MSKEYILLNGSRILYEEEYFVTDDGTPVFCWPSSFVLSNYIASHPELVQNKCVLELGAGVGLPGLVSAALGAHRVYFADKRENHVARRILERNLECNGFQSIGVYYPIDWGDCYPLEMEYPIEQLDIVIGSDLFYDPKQLEPTVMTIASLFRYHSKIPLYTVYHERSCKRSLGWLLDAWQLTISSIPLYAKQDLEHCYHLYLITRNDRKDNVYY